MITRALVGDWQLVQGYGPTDFGAEPPGHGFAHWHEGWDLACPVGTPCRATVAGVVARTGPGYLVLSDGRLEHYYFHVSAALLAPGAAAAAGQWVALSGQAAVAGGVPPTGPHLHYGVRRSPFGYQVDDIDPAPFTTLQEDDMRILKVGAAAWRLSGAGTIAQISSDQLAAYVDAGVPQQDVSQQTIDTLTVELPDAPPASAAAVAAIKAELDTLAGHSDPAVAAAVARMEAALRQA